MEEDIGHEVFGTLVSVSDLKIPRAIALARHSAAEAIPFVHLVECRAEWNEDDQVETETVIIEVEVERPQVLVHDVRKRELLAVDFHALDDTYPEVLSLRTSFPRVPHLNNRPFELPRSLCLYDRPWSEIALRWTAAGFVERIRDWLKLTAVGELHQEDQPLEQLLLSYGLRILLPHEILDDLRDSKPVKLDICKINEKNCVAVRQVGDAPGKKSPRYVCATLVAHPQTHGIIRRTPLTLADLHEFLKAGKIDLLGELREQLKDWMGAEREAQLVILVAFPLVRTDNGLPERWDFWAFMTSDKIREIGVKIGLWESLNGQLGVLIQQDLAKRGQDIPILVLSPYFTLSRKSAALANGVPSSAIKILAVGAGALGSQLIVSLARSGFGAWTIVDEDDLLPHNLARHALMGGMVGGPKASGLVQCLNSLYEEPNPAKAIVADVLNPGEAREELLRAYAEAEVVLDAAASVPVARHLALDVESPARRISLFLNPLGTDLVVIAEDKGRTITLDMLEAQYYRSAVSNPALDGHLGTVPGRLRYGRTCRDISSTIPSHLVTIHAAIAHQAVRELIASPNASIKVWRCDPQNCAVQPVNIKPSPGERLERGDWTLVIDQNLRTRLDDLRASRLPNETGGVLLGSLDLARSIIYIVDTVPSPPDSLEWPTLYVRGCEGLLARVEEMGEQSGGQLEYIGEWHSHPIGCPPIPSSDDLVVFGWLTEHMDHAGLPALMAIVSDGGSQNWFVGTMQPEHTVSFPAHS